MSTQLSGRVGGQYSVTQVSESKFQVKGFLYDHWHTIWTGDDYRFATKLLDYCASNDGRAQHAMQQLFFQGDPTAMLELIELAKVDPVARERRRVGVTLEIETDILVGEGAIEVSVQQITAAARMCGFRTTEVKGFYTDEGERERDTGRIAKQRDYLLDNMIVTQDGWFSFPDGTKFPCLNVEQAIARSPIISPEHEREIVNAVQEAEDEAAVQAELERLEQQEQQGDSMDDAFGRETLTGEDESAES